MKLNLKDLRVFVGRLQRALRLGRETFDVCLVDDQRIRRLNASFRNKAKPTDVLSFAWDRGSNKKARSRANEEFRNFLGDIVISTETARRNARAEGHSTQNEVRWLILHGLLHLKGYDHETDQGEMTALELSLRNRLKITGARRRLRRPRARVAE